MAQVFNFSLHGRVWRPVSVSRPRQVGLLDQKARNSRVGRDGFEGRSAGVAASVSPEVLEPLLAQFGVAAGVLD
jgi:hypothetical protein